MIIGIDASRATPTQRTGTEAYARFLLQAVIPLALTAGHEIRLYFNQSPPPGLFPAQTGVVPVHIPLRRLWTHLRLGRELRHHPPDVFFTPAHVIPLAYRGPSVATVHDLGYHYFPRAHPRWQLAYLRWSTRHNAHRGRLVIADSEATKTDLVRFYGVDASKVRVVYPGRDPGLARVTDTTTLATVQARYGITPPYLLYLGTLQPRKNIPVLIQAMARLDDPTIKLVLVGGKGWLYDDIFRQVQALGLEERVVFTGYVPDDELPLWYNAAALLVFPSVYEGFGLPVVEAMACGTPVIASNSSSIPEAVGEAGLLFDPNDVESLTNQMTAVLTDATLHSKLHQQGLEQAQRFSWERAGRETAAVYRRALFAE